MAAIVVMAGALIYIVPNLMRTRNQQQVQQIVVALDRAGQMATGAQPLQSGYATGGATVAITSTSAVLERGVPLGGATPTTIFTYNVSAPFAVWVQSTAGGAFTEQALPLTITVSASRQYGVVTGAVSSLSALPSTCSQIAIGTPPQSTPPETATYISCATGAVEENVTPD